MIPFGEGPFAMHNAYIYMYDIYIYIICIYIYIYVCVCPEISGDFVRPPKALKQTVLALSHSQTNPLSFFVLVVSFSTCNWGTEMSTKE